MFQELIPADANHLGFLTPCQDPEEPFKVAVRPDVTTIVSTQRTTPGTAISDRIFVEGTARRDRHRAGRALRAVREPLGDRVHGEARVDGNGGGAAGRRVPDRASDARRVRLLHVPRVDSRGPFVRAVQTKCAETAETAIVIGQPKVRTRVSALQTSPGKSITDKVIVTGLGALTARVKVELFGPFKTVEASQVLGHAVLDRDARR